MAEARTYYGTKRVEAWPEDRDYGVHGYAIRYPDGYESWSPKDVFEAAYHVETDMPFEGALAAMREGRKVQRIGIDWPGVAIFLNADGTDFMAERKSEGAMGRWHPSARDLLARWTIVE